jgi:hypothetical protein
METKPMPTGWQELEAHLEDDHGLGTLLLRSLEAIDARRWHRQLHYDRVFAVGRVHNHWNL